MTPRTSPAFEAVLRRQVVQAARAERSRQAVKEKRLRDRRASGFTLLELLLAAAIGLVVIGLALGFVLSSRNVYSLDHARTDANQNLRSGLDIIMADVRQAGERMGTDFSAVQVIKGKDGEPDTLILRRNLLNAVLPVCKDLTAGSDTDVVFFADNSKNPGNANCKSKKDGGTQNLYEVWHDYRTQDGACSTCTLTVYIYDPVTGLGEFFTYDADDDSNMQIHRASGDWANSYPAEDEPRIYMLDQRTYQLDSAGDLQLLVNGGTAQNVVAGITGFTVDAYLQPIDAATLSNGDGSFTDSQNWQSLAYIKVTLTAQDEKGNQTITRTLADQAVPRNVLSSPNAGKDK